MQDAKSFILYKIINERFIEKYANNWTRIRIKFEKEWLRVLSILNYQQLKMRLKWLDTDNNIKYSFYPPIPQEFYILHRSYMSNSYVEGFLKQADHSKSYSESKVEEMGEGKVKNLIKVVLLYHYEREITHDLIKYSTVIIKTFKKWEKQFIKYKNIDEALAGLYEIAYIVVEDRELRNNYRRLKND